MCGKGQMTTEDERRAAKRARSEAKRQESLQGRREFEKSRQAIVADALRKVDSAAVVAKRVVFDSDDEEVVSIREEPSADEFKSHWGEQREGTKEEFQAASLR